MSESLKLYSYWRSSAAYRVRIGLNLKRLAYDLVPLHLQRDGGEHCPRPAGPSCAAPRRKYPWGAARPFE